MNLNIKGTQKLRGTINDMGFEPAKHDNNYYFICYKRADIERVSQITQALSNNGYALWYDRGIAGRPYETFISEKITYSNAVLVFVSYRFINDYNPGGNEVDASDEFDLAQAIEKDIILVFLDDISDIDKIDAKNKLFGRRLARIDAVNAYKMEYSEIISEIERRLKMIDNKKSGFKIQVSKSPEELADELCKKTAEEPKAEAVKKESEKPAVKQIDTSIEVQTEKNFNISVMAGITAILFISLIAVTIVVASRQKNIEHQDLPSVKYIAEITDASSFFSASEGMITESVIVSEVSQSEHETEIPKSETVKPETQDSEVKEPKSVSVTRQAEAPYVPEAHYSPEKHGESAKELIEIAKREHITDWISESDIPSGAEIIKTIWKYNIQTEEYQKSEISSLEGWTRTGSEWQKTSSGTHKYAVMPGGFDTSHPLYSKYEKSELMAFENETSRRDVSGASVNSYIYWHWNYVLSSLENPDNRRISDKYGSYGNFYYTHFSAFESNVNSTESPESGVYKFDTKDQEDVSYWWFKIAVYEQNYTDYKKVYSYSRKVTGSELFESDSAPSGLDGAVNIKKLVKCRYYD